MRHSRTMLALAILAVLAAAMPFVAARAPAKKGKASRGKVLADVVAARVAESTMAPRMPATGFAPQSRRVFTAGDQWSRLSPPTVTGPSTCCTRSTSACRDARLAPAPR